MRSKIMNNDLNDGGEESDKLISWIEVLVRRLRMASWWIAGWKILTFCILYYFYFFNVLPNRRKKV